MITYKNNDFLHFSTFPQQSRKRDLLRGSSIGSFLPVWGPDGGKMGDAHEVTILMGNINDNSWDSRVFP
jgi:hypothetical protein